MSSPLQPMPTYPVPMPWLPPEPPRHPVAHRALVVGIIALAGGLTLIVPLLLGPLAWYWGATAKNAIERDPDQVGGRSDAKAGRILGMIASALLALGVALLALIAALLGFASTYEIGY